MVAESSTRVSSHSVLVRRMYLHPRVDVHSGTRTKHHSLQISSLYSLSYWVQLANVTEFKFRGEHQLSYASISNWRVRKRMKHPSWHSTASYILSITYRLKLLLSNSKFKVISAITHAFTSNMDLLCFFGMLIFISIQGAS